VVDRDLTLRKISDLETYLGQLAAYRDVRPDAYKDDWKTQRIVERTLHLTIEACMDIADHIVADRRLRVPETGAATFEILGFRTILVHDYARLDTSVVLRVLRTDLQDVERFREAVLQLVNPPD
jgi:uncharacterized protein YutE (UPF0331/DUF86 family)